VDYAATNDDVTAVVTAVTTCKSPPSMVTTMDAAPTFKFFYSPNVIPVAWPTASEHLRRILSAKEKVKLGRFVISSSVFSTVCCSNSPKPCGCTAGVTWQSSH